MDFRIKICGVTDVGDALAAIEAGADAIGLNFYEGSCRFVDIDKARRIAEANRDAVKCVGVFVNSPATVVHEIADKFGLQYVQLHGDEPPAFLRTLNCNAGIIRARRIDAAGMQPILNDLLECRQFSKTQPRALLVDATTPGRYGGSGRVADWHALAGFREFIGDTPLILAGGLTPDNVAEAIRIVRPDAVDVASGVESSPGKKDSSKMRAFVAVARAAFS
jgi:phosphoribosylanthranilate isomerase